MLRVKGLIVNENEMWSKFNSPLHPVTHGTYEERCAGQWTRRPERAIRDCGKSTVLVLGWGVMLSVMSKWAGFRRSTEIVSL